MDKYYDFSNAQTSVRKYGGSDKKIGIILNNEYYMLKFNDRVESKRRNEINSSYRNSAVSEYISCHIFESVGLPVQKTYLGVYNDKEVVACKDFRPPECELQEFQRYENAFLLSDEVSRYPEFSTIYKIIENEESLGNKNAVIERFWDTFIIDALLGNFDRHTGNWGFLINEKKEEISLAPIYDCGACLLPSISDEGIAQIINSNEAIKERIYKYPKPAFMHNGEKADYVEFLSGCEDENCNKSLLKIYPKINLDKIKNIIDNTPGISDIRKEFYNKYLTMRKELVLQPAYEKIRENLLEKHKEMANEDIDTNLEII